MFEVCDLRSLSAAERSQGVYVGRGSPLGNPFRIGVHGSRAEVIEAYEGWLRQRIAERDPEVCGALNRLWLRARRGERVRLLCFCAPRACHGEVIARVVGERL